MMSGLIKEITPELILSFSPCEQYNTVEKIIAATDKNWPKTPLQICNLSDNVSAVDTLWLLLRPEVISETDLHELACKFAETALQFTNDLRCREVIEVKRRWLQGKSTDEELEAAEAAWSAAEAAAWSAARAAARAARHPCLLHCAKVRGRRHVVAWKRIRLV